MNWRAGILKLLKWMTIAATLFLVLYFAATTQPERNTLLGSSLAMEAESLLNGKALRASADTAREGSIMVGWSQRSIVPPLETPTYGYSKRLRRGITEIADSVFVKALAISIGGSPPVVFLTADLCIWVPALSGPIERELSREFPDIFLYLGATHTHSGPGGYALGPADRLVMGGIEQPSIERVIRNSISAVRAAVAGLRPGSFRSLSAAMPHSVRNRLGRQERVDDELTFLEFRSGTERCAMVFFDAHATTVGAASIICSADYPGEIARGLGRQGYSEVLFFAGSTGQAGALLCGHDASGTGTAIAREYGDSLLARIIPLAESGLPFASITSLCTFSSPILLPPYQFRLGRRILRPEFTRLLLGTTDPIARVTAIRIGTTLLISHSFEFSSVLARSIREQVRTSGYHLRISGFNGTHYLYVVPDQYYDDDSYEPPFSLFGPSLGSYLERITIQLATFMTSPAASPEPFDLTQ